MNNIKIILYIFVFFWGILGVYNFGMAQQSAIILSPRGGEQWEIGKTYTVQWSPLRFIVDKISLSLVSMKDGVVIGVAGLNSDYSTNDGIERVTIPPSTQPGNYKIRVNCDFLLSVTCFQSYADSEFFSVVAPVPTLVQPSLPSQYPSSILAPIDIGLRIGSRGKNVTNLQKGLQNLGFYNGPITGYYGSLTAKAVIQFQERYREEVLSPVRSKRGTGVFGFYSRIQFNKILNNNNSQSIIGSPIEISDLREIASSSQFSVPIVNTDPQQLRQKALLFLKDFNVVPLGGQERVGRWEDLPIMIKVSSEVVSDIQNDIFQKGVSFWEKYSGLKFNIQQSEVTDQAILSGGRGIFIRYGYTNSKSGATASVSWDGYSPRTCVINIKKEIIQNSNELYKISPTPSVRDGGARIISHEIGHCIGILRDISQSFSYYDTLFLFEDNLSDNQKSYFNIATEAMRILYSELQAGSFIPNG